MLPQFGQDSPAKSIGISRTTLPQDGDLCVAKIPRGKNKGMYFRRYQELDRRSALLVAINRDGKSMLVRKSEVELFLVTGAKYTRQNRK